MEQAASAREPTSITQNQEVPRTEIGAEGSQTTTKKSELTIPESISPQLEPESLELEPQLSVTKEHIDVQKAREGIEIFNHLLNTRGEIDESYGVKYQNHKWSVEKDGSNLSVIRTDDQSTLLEAKDNLVITWTANKKEQEMFDTAITALKEMQQNAFAVFYNFLKLEGQMLPSGEVKFRGRELEISRNGRNLRVTRHKDQSTLLLAEGERVIEFTPNQKELEKIHKIEEYVVQQLKLQKQRQRESQMEL